MHEDWCTDSRTPSFHLLRSGRLAKAARAAIRARTLHELAVGDVYIKTRWCYVYAYSEDALIDTDEMVIHFLDSDDECDIEKILVGR